MYCVARLCAFPPEPNNLEEGRATRLTIKWNTRTQRAAGAYRYRRGFNLFGARIAGIRLVLAGAKVLLYALFIGSLEAMDDIGMCVCVAPLGSKMIRKSANIHAAQHVYVIISVQFAFQ